VALIPPATEFNYRTGTPRQSLTNMYAEPTTQGPRSVSLRGRPGLLLSATRGLGPIRLIQPNRSGTGTYVVSGSAVYYNATLIGLVSYGEFVQGAASEAQTVITSGGRAYLLTPTSVTLITDPDLPTVSGVVFCGGRFVYPNKDSSQYHYSAVGDATSIDGLDYSNTEGSPDWITRAETLGDEIAFFGTETIEYHRTTTDPNTPFVRADGRTQPKGSISPASITLLDNGLYFLGQEAGFGRAIYRTDGGVAAKISNPSIDYALALASEADIIDASAFGYVGEGHSWYVVNIPSVGSFAYDILTKTWAEWASYGLDTFRVTTGANGLYGDHTGKLYTFDPSAFDDNGDPLVRVCSALVPIEARVRCNVLSLECATGVSTVTGEGSSTVAEMRYTDEVTGDYSDWEACELGETGERQERVSWRQLGLMHPPGRLFEFRISEPVESVVYGASLNARP
jgi:hypothetical protein